MLRHPILETGYGLLDGVLDREIRPKTPREELENFRLLDPDGYGMLMAWRAKRDAEQEAEVCREVYAWLERRYAKQLSEKTTFHTENTIEQYTQACRAFLRWCDQNGFRAPDTRPRHRRGASPAVVARFLHDQLEAGAKHSSIKKFVAAIAYLHTWAGLPSPCDDPLVLAIKLASQKGERAIDPNDH
jgi:hypothetical protein